MEASLIFGLLFLKRLSDRFEEEAEKLIAEGLSEREAWTNPDEHQFFVPDRARGNTIRTQATNIGETLNKACAALEEHPGPPRPRESQGDQLGRAPPYRASRDPVAATRRLHLHLCPRTSDKDVWASTRRPHRPSRHCL